MSTELHLIHHLFSFLNPVHSQFNALSRQRHNDIPPYLLDPERLAQAAAAGNSANAQQSGNQKKEDTLFGPLVAPAPNPGAEWLPKPTSVSVPTPEIVNSWIAKSHDVSRFSYTVSRSH